MAARSPWGGSGGGGGGGGGAGGGGGGATWRPLGPQHWPHAHHSPASPCAPPGRAPPRVALLNTLRGRHLLPSRAAPRGTTHPPSPPPPPPLPLAQTGAWKHTKGDIGADEGIQTSEDARFYSLTAPLTGEVNNKGKDLIVSYTVRHDQVLDCGGAYLKLTPPGFDAKKFGGDTPYSIMFGPDVCGTSTRKTHVIFTYQGKNHLVKKNVRVETDKLSHRYTLIVSPNNTYTVEIDGKKAESGSIYDDFDMLAPAQILDPEDK